MGEIRIVHPGKTRVYPYLVCKKDHGLSTFMFNNPPAKAFGLSLHTGGQTALCLSLRYPQKLPAVWYGQDLLTYK